MKKKIAINKNSEYRANFLWPHEDDSVEGAGYEFANARTEEYRKMWWEILVKRIKSTEKDLVKKDEVEE